MMSMRYTTAGFHSTRSPDNKRNASTTQSTMSGNCPQTTEDQRWFTDTAARSGCRLRRAAHGTMQAGGVDRRGGMNEREAKSGPSPLVCEGQDACPEAAIAVSEQESVVFSGPGIKERI